MGRSVASRRKGALLLGLVSPEHQEVADAQELQVYEHILQVLPAVAAAHDMRHHRYPISLLNGCGNGYRTRTSAHTLTLHQSSLQIMIHILTPMAGDVDIERIELPELFYRAEQVPRSVTLQGRQHFKGEGRALMAIDHFCYSTHLYYPNECMGAWIPTGHNTPNWV